ncbi:MAG: DUF1127 domain-containing protein [Loktanella sp.]|nr:DUF1127 domain-containing protein [Loktanella sp.]
MSPSLHAAQIALLNDQARLPSVAYVLITMAVMVTKWDRYRRTRKALSGLEPHLLEDVGLTREAAYNEARKPFWKD